MTGFELAAKKLGCDVAAIKAVAEVEANGDGFVPSLDGSRVHCVRLFERHKFHKYTGGRYSLTHPHISSRTPGGYAKGRTAAARQHAERERFSEAFLLDHDAALLSTSWGKFQIMGFNHRACGFSSPHAFVDAMKESEAAQLDAFVNFLLANHLEDALREHNWDAFAQKYNGPAYRKNNYHLKLEEAHRKFNYDTYVR